MLFRSITPFEGTAFCAEAAGESREGYIFAPTIADFKMADLKGEQVMVEAANPTESEKPSVTEPVVGDKSAVGDESAVEILSEQQKQQKEKDEIFWKILTKNFHLPISEACKAVDVCSTLFRSICRKHGIHRWPYRNIKRDRKSTRLNSSHT